MKTITPGVIHGKTIELLRETGLADGQEVTVTLEPVADPLPPADTPGLSANLEPKDDWERGLLALATDCGVSLSHEAVSSEGLYD